MVRIHPEHGVNPSIFTCFICGKDMGVVLLGAAYKGRAPVHIGVLDDRPCPECKGWMAKGIILISVRDGEEARDPKNPYRTGGWVVVKEEAARRMFTGAVLDFVLKKRVAFVPDSVWDAIGLPREAAKETP